MVPISLNEVSLLSVRQKVLRDHEIVQNRLLRHRPRRLATEESRRKQKDDYEVAVIRRRLRQERDIAIRSNHLIEKLQKLEQRHHRSQELYSAQLSVVRGRMRQEQETFHRQRAEIFKKGIVQPTNYEQNLLIIVVLAISSPLWIPGVLVYHLYNRAYV